MPNRLWVLTLLVAVFVVGTFKGLDRAAAGDGSVRFLTAGPLRLGDGHTAHMRVLLPAVRPSTPVHFVGEGGKLLRTVNVEPPADNVGPLFEVTFDAKFEGVGAQRFGTMSITDGTSNTIFLAESNGIIAILIGLRQGKGMGTMQLVDPQGQTVGILPYIEQDNLFRFAPSLAGQ